MNSKLIYIVGPCAAESREQLMETAELLSRMYARQAFIFRAGVWKPRTSPKTFQGAGEKALGWLQEVKERYCFPVATEVATKEHVTKALEAGIDYLWIGARSSATPIVVQALADAICNLRLEISDLKGILVKNPVNEDAGLWLGNIERLEKIGVPVMAVHRGCGHQPCWHMAHEVRLARPDIPMLLDPSHMSGDAGKVPVLMEKIDELGLDGAMIEVHCHPQEALSDASQQITPETLIQNLSPRPLFKRGSQEYELNWLRSEIDELDERLWDTIASRMRVSQRIGEWKKAHGVAPLQPERYEKIVESLKLKVERLGLSEDFIMRVWEQIHEESLRQQK